MIYVYSERFCQKNFFLIMFYGMSLWFGIIKYSLDVYQSQIPVDQRDRLYYEDFISKGVKSEPLLKR